MNKANLLRVADAIEKHEIKNLGFNMKDWVETDEENPDRSGFSCGTTACVAGWATMLHLRLKDEQELLEVSRIPEHATDYLDLNVYQAERLFMWKDGGRDDNDSTTSAMAVRTLRYAAEHGVIDWDAANPPEAS